MRCGLISALFAAVFCCGCRPTPPDVIISTGGPTGSHLWTKSAEGPDVPGLDSGRVYYVGKLLLMWTAAASGGSEGTTSSGRDGARGDGQVTFRGGKQVPYTFRMPDEKTGTVVIDGTEYQLTGGRVFLVKRVGDTVVVKQLDKDLTGIDLAKTDFQALGRADPAITGFFGAQGK
jgi:hypothetical protein